MGAWPARLAAKLLLGAAVLTWDACAGDRPAELTIGFLSTQSRASRPTPGALEREILARRRIADGNVRFDYGFAEGNTERLEALARGLLGRRPAMLFCADFHAARAAAAVTSDVPIVFVAHVDPVEHRFLASLRSSNRNITGVTTFRPVTAKMVEVALDAFPGARVVAALLDLNELNAKQSVEPMRRLVERQGGRLEVHDVSTIDGLDAFIDGLSRRRPDVLIVPASAATWQSRARLVAAVGAHALPALYESEPYVAVGGLMSYGPSYVDVLSRVAEYVERVALGSPPAKLPVLQPTKTELLINLPAARRQGITLPRAFMRRADRFME